MVLHRPIECTAASETGQVKIGPKPLFRQSDKSKVENLSAPFVSISAQMDLFGGNPYLLAIRNQLSLNLLHSPESPK